jgi:phytol kinase
VLSDHPWLAIVVEMAAFLLLFAALEVWSQKKTTSVRPETTRKLLHVGSGILTLAFPFLFVDVWPVALLSGGAALVLAAARFAPGLRARCVVVGRVARASWGEFYFPLSVVILFWLSRGEHPLLFAIPVLVLTLADTAAAVVGTRFGTTWYCSAGKSVEGSLAFAIVAFVSVCAPLAAWSSVGPTEAALTAATLALLLALLEGIAQRGLDNLLIPLAGYGLLRGMLWTN